LLLQGFGAFFLLSILQDIARHSRLLGRFWG